MCYKLNSRSKWGSCTKIFKSSSDVKLKEWRDYPEVNSEQLQMLIDQLDKVKVSGAKEYILAISDIFTGKFARYLVQGEEIEGSDGKENWVKATLPLYPKVESMEIKDTKLFFDADKHISKLVVPDVDAMAKESATADGNDGLPF